MSAKILIESWKNTRTLFIICHPRLLCVGDALHTSCKYGAESSAKYYRSSLWHISWKYLVFRALLNRPNIQRPYFQYVHRYTIVAYSDLCMVNVNSSIRVFHRLFLQLLPLVRQTLAMSICYIYRICCNTFVIIWIVNKKWIPKNKKMKAQAISHVGYNWQQAVNTYRYSIFL